MMVCGVLLRTEVRPVLKRAVTFCCSGGPAAGGGTELPPMFLLEGEASAAISQRFGASVGLAPAK